MSKTGTLPVKTLEVLTPPKRVSLATPKLDALAKRLNRHHAESERQTLRGLKHAYECGRLLAEVKGALPHGMYENWVEEHTSFGLRMSQMYKQIYEKWAEIQVLSATIPLVTLSAAIKMLAVPKPRSRPEGIAISMGGGELKVLPTVGTPETASRRVQTSQKSPAVVRKLMVKHGFPAQLDKLIALLLALSFDRTDIEARLGKLS